MIRLHRLNGKEFVLNCDLIKSIEASPDTILTLTTGEKWMVRESVGEVIASTIEFRRNSRSASLRPPEREGAE